MNAKVLIGVPMGELGRYNQFHNFLNQIQRPENTITLMVPGRSAAQNRNIIIEEALEKGFTHVLFLDDDMAPEPNILYMLLRHRIPIVTGLYFTRKFPHQPVLFSTVNDENEIIWHELEDGRRGLIEVEGCGLGACLIETEVFRNMANPWIRFGEISRPDSWCHDVGFFRRARKAGYLVWCDLDCNVGHIGEVVIKPKYMNGKWYTNYNTNGNAGINVARPADVLETV